MIITVEISLLPLADNYVPVIKDFLTRLQKHPGLKIVTNAVSTSIVGEHHHVFDVLSKETAITFGSGRNVFAIKVLGFERDIKRQYN